MTGHCVTTNIETPTFPVTGHCVGSISGQRFHSQTMIVTLKVTRRYSNPNKSDSFAKQEGGEALSLSPQYYSFYFMRLATLNFDEVTFCALCCFRPSPEIKINLTFFFLNLITIEDSYCKQVSLP